MGRRCASVQTIKKKKKNTVLTHVLTPNNSFTAFPSQKYGGEGGISPAQNVANHA